MAATDDRPRHTRRGRPRVGTRIPGVTLRDDELAAVHARMEREGCDRAEAIRRFIRDSAGLGDPT